MKFSTKHINLIVAPKGTNVNIRAEATTKSKVLFNRKNNASEGKVASAGRTTGDYVKDGDYIWYKITLYKQYAGQTWGWVRNDVIRLFKPKADTVSKEQAQRLVDKLVQSDQEVYKKSLLLAPLLEQAEKQGKNVTSLKEQFKGIIQRLETRQNKIKTSKLLKWKAGLQKGLTWFKNAFKTYLLTQYGIAGDSIGALGAIVVGAVIGGGLAVAAYFAFRADYDESTIDLKTSKELEKALSLLTPEEAKTLQQNLEKQIDEAAKTGYTSAKFGSALKLVKYGVVIVAAFWIGSKVLSLTKKAKTNE